MDIFRTPPSRSSSGFRVAANYDVGGERSALGDGGRLPPTGGAVATGPSFSQRTEGGFAMKSGNEGPGRATGRFAACALVTVLVVSAAPTSTAEEVVLERRDAARVLDSAVTYYYQKTVERKVVESACFFDPKVENSMRCSWRWASGGADKFRMGQRVKKDGKKWCKKAGGKKCTLFWQNGSLRFDGLSPEHSKNLESVLANIPDYVVEASPLPDGVGVGDDLRDRFPEVRDYWDGVRKKASRAQSALRNLCQRARARGRRTTCRAVERK